MYGHARILYLSVKTYLSSPQRHRTSIGHSAGMAVDLSALSEGHPHAPMGEGELQGPHSAAEARVRTEIRSEISA